MEGVVASIKILNENARRVEMGIPVANQFSKDNESWVFSASQDEKPLFLKAPSSAALHTTFPNCFSSFLQSSNLFSEVMQGGKVILTNSISHT